MEIPRPRRVWAQRGSSVLRRAKQVPDQVVAGADALRSHLLCSHAQPTRDASSPEASAEWIALLQRAKVDVNAMLPEFRMLVSLFKVLGIQLPYQPGARSEGQLKSLCAVEKDGRNELLRSI